MSARWFFAATLFPRATEVALKYDRLMTAARAVGLTDDEASEVFTTWQRAYWQTPYPLPWDRVNRAMVLRAMGDDWQPPGEQQEAPPPCQTGSDGAGRPERGQP